MLTWEDRRLWSVILAGGDGQRMRQLIQRWLGTHRPKQYCTFVGTRSMFQHTLDRSDMLTSPERRISVVACSHRAEVFRQIGRRQPGRILLQPANRDTAAGIFLALTHVRSQDPQAVVAVFPSDHFIFPDHCFIDTVRSAAQAVATWRDRIILLAAAPDRPESDYGWIHPGRELGWSHGCPIHAVRSFVEKPSAAVARQAMEEGALWNTLVFVARVETLWNLGRQCFPLLMDLFERLKAAIGSGTDQVAVTELRDVVWSDWGRPERIAGALEAIGKQPSFPREHAYAS
jgi:mannose-1-phosphate guanylyltransferase